MTQEEYKKATPIIKLIEDIKDDIKAWRKQSEAMSVIPDIRVLNSRGDIMTLYISDKQLAELNIKAAEIKLAEQINKLNEL